MNDKLERKGSDNADYDIYFIVNGVVQNLTTKRYFEKGQMINH